MAHCSDSYHFEPTLAIKDCVEWIRNYFDTTAKPNSIAVIGISGGKDSTVAAALCVSALGKDRVVGVLMPNGEQRDIQDSIDVCNTLGIKYFTVNLKNAFGSIMTQIDDSLHHCNTDNFERTAINLPARLRMSVLYAVAQSFDSARVVNTCNTSEDYVGYSTLYGDSAGDFAPLQSFTVTEIKAIGKALGLPDRFVNKTPSDGLCGKTDEDKLGFTYEELDDYIRKGVEPSNEKKLHIDKLHADNLFKESMIQIPKFVF